MAKIEQSIEVDVPLQTAYNHWTQFEKFPRFMSGVTEVRQIDDSHLRWRGVRGGQEVEWETEITQQIPDQRVAWRATTGAGNIGNVMFHPVDKNKTRITLSMEREPIGQPFSDSDTERTEVDIVRQDLARYKALIEQQGITGGAWRGEIQQGQVVHTDRHTNLDDASRSANKPVAEPPDQTQVEAEKAAEDERRQSERPAESPAWLPNIMHVWGEPFVLMRRMTEEMDQLFEKVVGRSIYPARWKQSGAASNWTPPVEVSQRDNRVVICAELPGIKREDVQIEITNDKLTIEGDRREEGPQAAQPEYRSERRYGHFYREIPLPAGVDPDAAEASMHDGLLEISFPAPTGGRRGRRLDIQPPH
jgi:HSP20 family molecular chaperone IbpA/carbon monoxide dehydrogenase subunit G